MTDVEAIEVARCADGTWQATLWLTGSNHGGRFNGATPQEAFAVALAAVGEEVEAGEVHCTCAEDSDEPWRDHARTCPIYDPAYDKEG